MGSRIESLLVLLIFIFLSMSFHESSKNINTHSNIDKKELQFKSATLREINQTSAISTIVSLSIIKRTREWQFSNIKFYTSGLVLTAPSATQKNNIITFGSNVAICKDDETRYYAENIEYNRKSKNLNIKGGVEVHNRFGKLFSQGILFFNDRNISGKYVKATYKME